MKLSKSQPDERSVALEHYRRKIAPDLERAVRMQYREQDVWVRNITLSRDGNATRYPQYMVDPAFRQALADSLAQGIQEPTAHTVVVRWEQRLHCNGSGGLVGSGYEVRVRRGEWPDGWNAEVQATTPTPPALPSRQVHQSGRWR